MVAAKFTGDAERDIARRYEAGESMYSIAKDLNCDWQPIRSALRRQGVKMRKSPKARKLTDEQIEEAVAMYKNSDLTVTEVASRFGISGPTLSGSLARRGVPTRNGYRRGELHQNWKGGRSVDKPSGYARIRVRADDPEWLRASASQNGDMLEHRYVMAKHLGRALRKDESVHHINGDRVDNRLENLQIRRRSHAAGIALVCACCGSTDIKEVVLE